MKFLRKISNESDYEAMRLEVLNEYRHTKPLLTLCKNENMRKVLWYPKMPASFDKSFNIDSFSTIK